jgi:formylglycine-generating enzyme required for sulfatase activity
MTNTQLLAISATESIPMIDIPAGEFLMGSDESDPYANSDEMPQHTVHLQEFSISQAPITQAQWRAVAMLPPVDRTIDPDPSYHTGDDLPVECVSWHDAMEFCARLSVATGKAVTLPSEAQWEYACRAGTTTAYAFGDTLTEDMANVAGDATTPVCSYPANAWGLHDMHGNVWEWCLDDYHASYEGAPTDGSAFVGGDSLGKSYEVDPGSASPRATAPLTAASTTPPMPASASASVSSAFASNRPRVLRGGSWNFYPRNCRSAYRNRNHPDNRVDVIGFRVCCLPHESFLSMDREVASRLDGLEHRVAMLEQLTRTLSTELNRHD